MSSYLCSHRTTPSALKEVDPEHTAAPVLTSHRFLTEAQENVMFDCLTNAQSTEAAPGSNAGDDLAWEVALADTMATAPTSNSTGKGADAEAALIRKHWEP